MADQQSSSNETPRGSAKRKQNLRQTSTERSPSTSYKKEPEMKIQFKPPFKIYPIKMLTPLVPKKNLMATVEHQIDDCLDISGMEYNEREIDAMIRKINVYQTGIIIIVDNGTGSQNLQILGKTLKGIAGDIGTSETMVLNFLKKNLTNSIQLTMLKGFQKLFKKLEKYEDDEYVVFLRWRVGNLESENNKLKKDVETFEYTTGQKDEQIKNLNYSLVKKDKEITNQNKVFKDMKFMLDQKDAELKLLKTVLDQKNEELENMKCVIGQKDEKIEMLQHAADKASNINVGASSSRIIYETPVKPEVSSQQSQNSRNKSMKSYQLELFTVRIKEAVAELNVKRRARRQKTKTYLIVDQNGIGRYGGSTIQELKARLAMHASPSSMVSSANLKNWIKSQEYLEAYVIFEGGEEEAEYVESLLINLGSELGFDLLNIKKEYSKLQTPTKLVCLDHEAEISVIVSSLPITKEAPGHEQLVANVLNMVELAMEQKPVRYYIKRGANKAKCVEDSDDTENETQSDYEEDNVELFESDCELSEEKEPEKKKRRIYDGSDDDTRSTAAEKSCPSEDEYNYNF